jgi:hypothetical protein
VTTCLDLSQPSISFSENVRDHIPNKGSLIYTVWDKDDSFLYVGIADLQRDLAKRFPLSRMISHASGVRGGDQFCVYIHDSMFCQSSFRREYMSLQEAF